MLPATPNAIPSEAGKLGDGAGLLLIRTTDDDGYAILALHSIQVIFHRV